MKTIIEYDVEKERNREYESAIITAILGPVVYGSRLDYLYENWYAWYMDCVEKPTHRKYSAYDDMVRDALLSCKGWGL